MVAIIYSCISLIHDRRNGSWNRELLSGVSISEILVAHLAVNVTIMVIAIAESVLIINFTMNFENHGNILMEISIIVLIYLAGVFFGLLFSCKFDDYTMAIYVCMGISILQIFITGSIW